MVETHFCNILFIRQLRHKKRPNNINNIDNINNKGLKRPIEDRLFHPPTKAKNCIMTQPYSTILQPKTAYLGDHRMSDGQIGHE